MKLLEREHVIAPQKLARRHIGPQSQPSMRNLRESYMTLITLLRTLPNWVPKYPPNLTEEANQSDAKRADALMAIGSVPRRFALRAARMTIAHPTKGACEHERNANKLLNTNSQHRAKVLMVFISRLLKS